MRICLVVAMTSDRIIGRDGQLPWSLPADLKHFRRLTVGHFVIMGRKTFESIGKPLKGRVNIIVTRQNAYAAPGCHVVRSPEEALQVAADLASKSRAPHAESDVMVIGGSSIYRCFLPQAQRMYVTLVHARLWGDTWFPWFDRDEWVEVERKTTSQTTGTSILTVSRLSTAVRMPGAKAPVMSSLGEHPEVQNATV